MCQVEMTGGKNHTLMIADLSSCPAGSTSGRTLRQKIITCTQITTTSHGTSRFVSERRFGMGCPSHLQVCYRFKKPTVFIV